MTQLAQLGSALVAFAAGVGLRRVWPRAAAAPLHAYVVWVALPALILVRVPALEVGPEVGALIALPWALWAVAALLVIGVARRARWPRAVEGALLMVVPLANTSFLGLPLVEAHLGRDAVPLAIVWDQLGSFLLLSTAGAFVLAAYRGGDAARPGLGAIARAVVRFPPFVALLVALALGAAFETSALAPLQEVLAPIGASLVPVVMVAIGLQWRARLRRGDVGPASFALAVRLALIPLIAWGLADALALPSLATGAVVLEAGMGPMITAGALAIEAGLAPELGASIVGWGTLLSFGTTALWAALLA